MPVVDGEDAPREFEDVGEVVVPPMTFVPVVEGVEAVSLSDPDPDSDPSDDDDGDEEEEEEEELSPVPPGDVPSGQTLVELLGS